MPPRTPRTTPDVGRKRVGAIALALALLSPSWWTPGVVASQAAGITDDPITPVAEVGAVSGTVELLVVDAPPPPRLNPYSRPRYRPPARVEGPTSSPEGVVVYLRGEGAVPTPPPEVVPIVQRDRTIIPHVTPIQAGTRVTFPNDDDVFHNIFSLSSPHRFNLGRYPPGETRVEVFERPGVVRLFCDIHSEMGGIILVLDTPYFARPDEQGRFRIDGVPPGQYTAIAWHEVAGADSARVVVRDGAATNVDFLLGR